MANLFLLYRDLDYYLDKSKATNVAGTVGNAAKVKCMEGCQICKKIDECQLCLFGFFSVIDSGKKSCVKCPGIRTEDN